MLGLGVSVERGSPGSISDLHRRYLVWSEERRLPFFRFPPSLTRFVGSLGFTILSVFRKSLMASLLRVKGTVLPLLRLLTFFALSERSKPTTVSFDLFLEPKPTSVLNNDTTLLAFDRRQINGKQ